MPTKFYLVIEYQDLRYTGCLMFDEASFCRHMQDVLQTHIGCSIRQIGDLDLDSTF
jgi:hypothetical protein